MHTRHERIYDVAILGSGLGGTLLATALARHGLAVLIIESGVHPRFAIGEAMIPETGGLLRLLADRYDVPEFRHLSSFHEVSRHVSTACGVKRSFSFVYQRPGVMPKGEETNMFPTLPPPFGPDSHFFRQDTDAYLLAAAARYGADVEQRCQLEDFRLEGETWTLEAAGDRRFQARYLVDGSGARSPLAARFGLRDTPCRQRTDTRGLFTHMVGVRPYDEVAPPRRAHRMPLPFAEGTLHHVFDGGWMWVIPFDNHRNATNALCSVGLMLDRRQHPERGDDPEAEFAAFLARHPGIAAQFEDARAVRPWVSSGRIQYSSKQVVGERFCLLPQAAGFVDPLFSSGMGMTVSAVGGLVGRLIRAARTGDYATAHFKPIERRFQQQVDQVDRVVAGAYDSFMDFRLWNAWFRIWATGNFYGAMNAARCHLRYHETGDRAFFEAIEEEPWCGFGSCALPEYRALLNAAEEEVLAARAGTRPPDEAAARIFALLAEHRFMPAQFHAADPAKRGITTFTLLPIHRMYFWGRYRAPERIRQQFFDMGLFGVVRAAVRMGVGEIVHALRTGFGVTIDMLRSRPARRRPRASSTVPTPHGVTPTSSPEAA